MLNSNQILACMDEIIKTKFHIEGEHLKPGYVIKRSECWNAMVLLMIDRENNSKCLV